MTQNEIERITELQSMGFGYKKISSVTGININAVKSHCRRHPVESSSKPASEVFCKGCGMPITRLEKKKPKQFCSDSCRMKWWNSHRELVKHKTQKKKCIQCGTLFIPKSCSSKFCSRRCYDDFRRKAVSE